MGTLDPKAQVDNMSNKDLNIRVIQELNQTVK